MKTKLISLTSGSADGKLLSAEELIVYTARVSNPENQMNFETSDRLIAYLIKHKHWSPFEMADMTIEITTSRAIAAQILRHRSFSFQEFCMSGDSKIYFDLPNAVSKNKRSLYKLKLKDIYRKWSSKNAFGNDVRTRIEKMFVRVYDENTKTLSHAHIKDVFQTGVKPLFEITLSNGKKIKCTKEHKVLSQNGFVSLEEGAGLELIGKRAVISKKDFLIGTNGIHLHQSYDWLLSQKNESIKNKSGVQGIADNGRVSYHTIRKWLKIHKLQFTKTEVAQYATIWNKNKFGYKNTPHTIGTILKMRASAKKGIDSNLWKGGVDRRERLKIADWCQTIRAEKLIEANYECKICKSNKKLELDHIVAVYENLELAYQKENIQVLCHECHVEKHNLKGDRQKWRQASKGNLLTIDWATIKSVSYIGEEMTYDLEIDHHSHNYVADGVIVHNSQRYSKAQISEQVQLRLKAQTNRQSSSNILKHSQDDMFLYNSVQHSVNVAFEVYQDLLDNGIAKECARMILPLATSTTLYAKGSIRSWIHYLQIRCDEHTQAEHRWIAEEIKEIFKTELPNIARALDW
jgi:thymidylate synthase (FAD)